MKRNLFAVFVVSMLLLSTVHCKQSNEVNSGTQYVLTVSISTGVDGSPTNGSFTYDKDHVINYQYTLQNGYGNLRVMLDGNPVNATGTFTMNSNHTLTVTADAAATYALSVNVGTGVNGTPASGNYPYSNGTTVNYSYSLQNGYTNLQVLLDGNPVNASGTITMDGNHSLTVTADSSGASHDVRGTWQGTMTDANGDNDLFNVTFSGSDPSSGNTSGWVVNNSSVGNGTFTVNGSSIEFTLIYGAVRNFVVTGTLTSATQMSGDWVWTNHEGNKFYGTFSLTKQ